MYRGLFITGTDTNVGKTVVSAALLHRYRHIALTYWKPIQTGIEQDDDTKTVSALLDLPSIHNITILDQGYRLSTPVSPHLAAQQAGVEICLARLLKQLDDRSSQATYLIEGAGGLLVPLNKDALMVDLIARLGLAVVIVARSGLGTINHTLLTIEALRQRQLEIAAVIMCGIANPENRQAIEHYGQVKVVGEMPIWASLTAPRLATWATQELDKESSLEKYLI